MAPGTARDDAVMMQQDFLQNSRSVPADLTRDVEAALK
jgi:hypothetical protein